MAEDITATNPDTGERIRFDASTKQWMPIETQAVVSEPTPITATNPETGQRIQFNPETKAWEPLVTGNELTRGVVRGAETTASLIGEGLPGVAKGLANQGLEKAGFQPQFDPTENLKVYKEQVNAAYLKNPTNYSSYEDVLKQEGLANKVKAAGGYAAATVGEQVPQLGLSLATGGIGAFVGKQAVQSLAKRAGVELTEQEIKKGLTQGVLTGAIASSASQNVPESYFNLLEKGEDNAAFAVGVGALKSGLDSLTEMSIFNKLTGPLSADLVSASLLKRIGVEAGKTAALEGSTEAAQEGLDILAEHFVGLNPDLTSPETMNRLIDNGLKGAIGGGFVGAGAAPFISSAENTTFGKEDYDKLSVKDKEDLDKKVAVEVIGQASGNIKTTIDPINPVDDTIITPLYVPDEALNKASVLGVNKESLGKLSPNQIVDVNTTMTNLGNPSNVSLTSVSSPDLKDQANNLFVRKENLDNGFRKDTDFIPGDGEIVVGAEVNQEPTVINPASQMKVDNSNNLQTYTNTMAPVDAATAQALSPKKRKAAAPKKQSKAIDKLTNVEPSAATPAVSEVGFEQDPNGKPMLPQSLRKGGGNFGKTKLTFPSDIEKALYIVAPNAKGRKSEKHDEYVDWLKEATGLGIPEINKLANNLRKATGMVHNRNPSVETLLVPEVDLGVRLRNDKQTLQANGDILSDYINNGVSLNNLKQIELTEEGKYQYASLIKAANQIVQSVAGKGADFKPFSKLEYGLHNEPVLGAQFLNAVYVAFNHTTGKSVDETAYHESWHLLERIGTFSKQQVRRMNKDIMTLKKYFDKDEYLSEKDFEIFYTTPSGREELRANAFGKMAIEYKASKDAINSVPLGFRKAFIQALNFINNFGSRLRNQFGLQNFNDFVKAAVDGQYAQDYIDNAMLASKQIRFQRMSKEYQDKVSAQQDKDYEEIVADARQEANNLTEISGKRMGMYGRYLQSFAHAASENPFIGQVFDSVKRRLMASNNFLSNYVDALGDYQNLSGGEKFKLHELADELRQSNQKPVLDADGLLTFERGGNTVRLNNKELSRQFMQMQAAYAKVLEHYSDLIKEGIFKQYKIELGDINNVSYESLMKLLDVLPSDTSSLARDKIKKTADVLKSVKLMEGTAFVPHMRFGNYGITVRDRATGEQIGFFTVEGGSFKKLYNKFQLTDLQRQLQEKYSDASKYDIIGDNGKITDLSSIEKLVPFKLTHDKLKTQIDPRHMNIELLSSLLASKDLDAKAYEELRDAVFNDIVTRGFTQRFSESKNIDGYSRDWTRVQHAYLSGAAHYLSGVPHSKELSAIKIENDKLKDTVLQKKVASYLDYTGSPQEDFQMMRQFNFLWTMGGNLSTAALQVMTLPTNTLGALMQFSPNPVSNMATISKWMTIGLTNFANPLTDNVYTENGLSAIDFRSKEIWDKLIAKGLVTEQDRQFMIKMFNQGEVKGTVTSESVGQNNFESRSRGGGVAVKLNRFAELAGKPIGLMEQLTRFATTMATYEILNKPANLQRAKRVLANDYRFQAQLQNSKNMSFAEHAASFTMDEAHGVFGKLGRAEFMRHSGGALFFPFMTYPQQSIEFMTRMYGRGPEGKRALAATLGSLFLFRWPTWTTRCRATKRTLRTGRKERYRLRGRF